VLEQAAKLTGSESTIRRQALRRKPTKAFDLGVATATCDYRSADGQLIARVERFEATGEEPEAEQDATPDADGDDTPAAGDGSDTNMRAAEIAELCASVGMADRAALASVPASRATRFAPICVRRATRVSRLTRVTVRTVSRKPFAWRTSTRSGTGST
jgi:hypothetical protein